ncbi:hypothetical protein HYU13_02340, partial [Candidatus Woesearchaeota archaeon]|nr:hypothetical protein [Candidatus Woesearchaeota archaeon]
MSTAGAGGDTGSGISNVFSQVVKEPDSIAAHVGRLVIVLFLAIYVINPRFGDAIGGGVESFSLVTKVLGGIVGVGIFLLVGGMGMFGGKAEADAGEEGKLLSLGMPYITAEFKDWINRSPWAAKHLEFRLATPEGQFPFMFRKLRLEIMALMNFLLRLQVFIGKGKDIINIKKEVEDKVLKVVTTTRAAGRLKSDCAEYYEGNRFAQKRLSKNQLVWEGDTVP